VHYAGDGYVADLPGGSVTLRGEREADGSLTMDLGGRRSSAAVVRNGYELTIVTHGHSHRLVLFDPLEEYGDDVATSGAIVSPLPGKIIQVLVAEDAAVHKGDALLILEAMKMEHTVSAPGDGTVTRIAVGPGDQVEEGAELVVLDLGDGD
jgi:3-methylcrotonyl-CoA carboxylase alpha subunit